MNLARPHLPLPSPFAANRARSLDLFWLLTLCLRLLSPPSLLHAFLRSPDFFTDANFLDIKLGIIVHIWNLCSHRQLAFTLVNFLFCCAFISSCLPWPNRPNFSKSKFPFTSAILVCVSHFCWNGQLFGTKKLTSDRHFCRAFNFCGEAGEGRSRSFVRTEGRILSARRSKIMPTNYQKEDLLFYFVSGEKNSPEPCKITPIVDASTTAVIIDSWDGGKVSCSQGIKGIPFVCFFIKYKWNVGKIKKEWD